jgi:ATP-dependent helicase/nuclease subunit A
MNRKPIDQLVRDKVILGIENSHFVTAGAGAGKSTSIIERIITLVTEPDDTKRIRMTEIVAVTFTEKAAAELRHKLRSKLISHIKGLDAKSKQHESAAIALADIDKAAVGTIHSFALRLLRQYPLEAGLPLGFSVIDAGEAKKNARNLAQEILADLFQPENSDKIDKLAGSQIGLSELLDFIQQIGTNYSKLIGCDFLQQEQNPQELEPIIREWALFAHRKFGEAFDGRKESGLLTFDDLLLCANQLVSSSTTTALEVRQHLASKYRFFVVDEFQDTDPVQWEMIRSLVCDPIKQVDGPIPGKLVVVGDPKQSIYKFRGADITNFESVKSQAKANWGEDNQQHLIANFRSRPKIIDFVDSLYKNRPPVLGTEFESMHAEVAATEDQGVFVLDPGEFAYVAPNSREFKDNPEYFREVREPAERSAIVAVIQNAVREKSITSLQGGLEIRRPVKYSDIALLLPGRTSLVQQLQLFEELNIPYKSTDGTVVYARPVVRSLIAALRVISGSINGRDLWWALKSPIFGASDISLLAFKNLGHPWPMPISNFKQDQIQGEEEIVGKALSYLFSLYQSKRTAQPSEILELIYEQTVLHQSLDQLISGRFEHSCVRMVILHAKQWESSGGSGLLDYLDWIDQMEEEEVRENLPSPDTSDLDAVTVSTMHSSKGLEYEVVILGGMKHGVTIKLPMCSVGPNGAFEYQFYISSGDKASRPEVYSTGYFNSCLQVEKKLIKEEHQRLLYVAATRAKSYLFYSIFHQGINSKGEYFGNPWASYTRSRVLESVKEGKAIAISESDLKHAPVKFDLINKPSLALEDEISETQILSAIAKTKVSSIHKPSDTETKVDYYSESMATAAAYGTAFHALMEDLAIRGFDTTWPRLVAKANSRAIEFKVPDRAEDLIRDVRAASSSELITRAQSSNWMQAEQALTGYIGENFTSGVADLYFEDQVLDGLVVVDYKTNFSLPKEVIEKYRKQLSDYALLLEQATGRKVVSRYLLHVNEGVAKAIEV